MKNLIALCCIAITVTAFADTTPSTWTTSGNTYGVLRIDSTATQTIVSVPWESASATAGTAIKVKDIVKTANLTKGTDATGTGGDQLYCYSGNAYKMWQLNNEGNWIGAQVVAKDGLPAASLGGDETITRGDALILVRNDPSKPFYVHGQYTATAASLNVAKGSAASPAYSLVAPAVTTSTSLDTLASANVGTNDTVLVRDANGKMRSLVCRQVESTYKWGTVTKAGMGGAETFTPVEITVPAGEGFWYVSRGGSLNAPVN